MSCWAPPWLSGVMIACCMRNVDVSEKHARSVWLDIEHCRPQPCCDGVALNVMRCMGLAWGRFYVACCVAAAVAQVRVALYHAPCLFRGERIDTLPVVWLHHGAQHRRNAVRRLQHAFYGAIASKEHLERTNYGTASGGHLRQRLWRFCLRTFRNLYEPHTGDRHQRAHHCP